MRSSNPDPFTSNAFLFAMMVVLVGIALYVQRTIGVSFNAASVATLGTIAGLFAIWFGIRYEIADGWAPIFIGIVVAVIWRAWWGVLIEIAWQNNPSGLDHLQPFYVNDVFLWGVAALCVVVGAIIHWKN